MISLDPVIFVALVIPCRCQQGGLVRISVLTFRCGNLRSRQWFVRCVMVSPALTSVSSAMAICVELCLQTIAEVHPAANNCMSGGEDAPEIERVHICKLLNMKRSSSPSSSSSSSSSSGGAIHPSIHPFKKISHSSIHPFIRPFNHSSIHPFAHP